MARRGDTALGIRGLTRRKLSAAGFAAAALPLLGACASSSTSSATPSTGSQAALAKATAQAASLTTTSGAQSAPTSAAALAHLQLWYHWSVSEVPLTYLHAYGGRLYDPKTNVATGFENSADPINALQVLKDHTSGPGNVSSITLGPTEEQMSRGQASMLLRESSFIGYFRDHAPKLNFAISYVPPAKQDGCGLTGTGWALLVNKKSQIEQLYSRYLDQITQGQTQPKAAADALAPRIDQLLKQS